MSTLLTYNKDNKKIQSTDFLSLNLNFLKALRMYSFKNYIYIYLKKSTKKIKNIQLFFTV